MSHIIVVGEQNIKESFFLIQRYSVMIDNHLTRTGDSVMLLKLADSKRYGATRGNQLDNHVI